MNKWLAIIAVLRQGTALTDSATWKERQVLVNVVAGLLTAAYMLARAQGWIALEVDNAALLDLGSALGAILFTGYNVFFTVSTTDKIGLAKADPDPVPVPFSELRERPRQAEAGPVPADPKRVQGSDPERRPNPFLDGD